MDTKFNFVLENSLLQQLRQRAEHEQRSIGNLTRILLKRGLEQE